MKKKPCVYELVNTVNGMKYIGSTVNAELREMGHYSSLKSKSNNRRLQKDYEEFGKDAFVFTVISECSNIRQARSLEKKLINKGKNLYNIVGNYEYLERYMSNLSESDFKSRESRELFKLIVSKGKSINDVASILKIKPTGAYRRINNINTLSTANITSLALFLNVRKSAIYNIFKSPAMYRCHWIERNEKGSPNKIYHMRVSNRFRSCVVGEVSDYRGGYSLPEFCPEWSAKDLEIAKYICEKRFVEFVKTEYAALKKADLI